MPKTTKPKTVSEAIKYFKLPPRAAERFTDAINEDSISEMTWNTLRALAFACRDPKTTAKDITLSQKVIMYRRYDKLWQSISEAVRLYGATINRITVQPELGEDVIEFRTRYLKAVLSAEGN
jgi:hypothetical protein